MRSLKLLLLLPLLFGCTGSQISPIPKDAAQAVIVLTPDWGDVKGTIQRFERQENGTWTSLDMTVPIVIGRNGMAWGAGLHPEQTIEPIKREGDGRSPAGIFQLGPAFGYAPAGDMTLNLPYLPATEALQCVDDPTSDWYNQIVDEESIEKADWRSAEQMKLEDEVYKYGVVVQHNTAPCKAGMGSCIFLHVWRNPETGTSGCTAMPEPIIQNLLHWLDADKNPILIQMPAFVYNEYREKWQLP